MLAFAQLFLDDDAAALESADSGADPSAQVTRASNCCSAYSQGLVEVDPIT